MKWKSKDDNILYLSPKQNLRQTINIQYTVTRMHSEPSWFTLTISGDKPSHLSSSTCCSIHTIASKAVLDLLDIIWYMMARRGEYGLHNTVQLAAVTRWWKSTRLNCLSNQKYIHSIYQRIKTRWYRPSEKNDTKTTLCIMSNKECHQNICL